MSERYNDDAPMPVEIPGVGQVTASVFFGGAKAYASIPALQAAGVTHVLKLYFDDPYWGEPFTVFEHALEDGVFIPAEILEQGLAFIREGVAASGKVLVCCQLGSSRSATFVLAHLLEQGWDLREAFLRVRAVRPVAWPARALWETLLTHYATPYTLDQIENWIGEGRP